MNLNDIISSIKRLKLLIGENNFEEVFLKELNNAFKAEEIYLLNFQDSIILGWVFNAHEIKKVSYSVQRFEQDFNLSIENIISAKEELLSSVSSGVSQKVFVFKIENIYYILILKKINKPDLIPSLNAITEFISFILHCHYTLIKLKERVKEKAAENLAMLVHEIKNPLAAIKTATELLTSPDVSEEDKRNLTKMINSGILELTEEIDNLCYQSVKQTEVMQTFSLLELINEIVEEVKPLAFTKNINILTDLKDIPFYGNRIDLKKAFMNLIINAIKYNKQGGKVFINSKEKKNKIIIKIRDTGIGIPKENQNKIFNKFFRGEHNNVSGTGLGLYIVKNIIELYHGKIKVISKEGEGSEFIVTLPLGKTKVYKSFYFLVMTLILVIFAFLNIYPLIPYKPLQVRTEGLIVFKTKSNSVIRIKEGSDYNCVFRKTLLGTKDKALCELRNGDAEADLIKTKILVKTSFITVKNIGTSFDIFTYNKNTGISVFDGALVGKDKKLESGTGAIVDNTIKTYTLLNSSKEISEHNLPSGDLEITWQTIDRATKYEVMIAEDKEFYKIIKVLTTKEQRIRLTLLKDGYYYIKIYGIDENGLKGFPAIKEIKNLRHLTLGINLRKEGKYNDALQEFMKSFNDFGCKEVLPLSEIAWTYYITGDFDLAENKYKEALKIKSTIIDLSRLARIYYHKNRLEESKKIYMTILSEQPDNLDSLWGLAEVFIKEKNLFQAEKYLEKIKNIDNTYPLLHYSYAKIYLHKGLKERALKEIETELSFHPTSYEAKQLRQEIMKNK
jgi:signal transduction histidine kinase/tetratricopeptide (TPR) repeat protein